MINHQQINIENLIISAMSPSDEIRKPADTFFNKEFDDNANLIIQNMSKLMINCQKDDVRHFCSILLARKFGYDSESLFEKLTEENKLLFKNTLLECFLKEKVKKIRTQISYSISRICPYTLCQGDQPDLIPFLIKCFDQKSSSIMRRNVIYIFGELCETAIPFMISYNDLLLKLFKESLSDFDIQVSVETINSIAKYLSSPFDEDTIMNFDTLMPQILNCFKSLFDNSKKEEEDLETLRENILDSFLAIATFAPDFFQQDLDNQAQLIYSIGSSNDYNNELRELCLEFFVLIAENIKFGVRNSSNFIRLSFSLGLLFMISSDSLSNEHTENQRTSDGDSDYDEDDLYEKGEMALDRLASAIGHQNSTPIVFPILQKFLSDENQRSQYVALMAFSQIGESLPEEKLGDIVSLALSFFKNNNIRLRYAAINCIGQQCTDFSPKIQNKFHHQIIPAFIFMLDDRQNPRILSHTASALINFCQDTSNKILDPYLTDLLPRLFSLLDLNIPSYVREQVTMALSSFSRAIVKKFPLYCENFISYLMQIASNMNKEQRTEKSSFYSNAIECLTYVLFELGDHNNKYRETVNKLMQLTIQNLELKKQYEDSNKTSTYDFSDHYLTILQAWLRVSKILKQDFAYYLEKIMPFLYESALIECVFSDGNQLENKIKVLKFNLDLENLSDACIQYQNIEEKRAAMAVLSSVVSELGINGKAFLPYIEKTAEIFLTLVDFQLDDDIQEHSLTGLCDILRIVRAAYISGNCGISKESFINLFICVIERLSGLINDESHSESTTSAEFVINLVEAIQTIFLIDGQFTNDYLKLDNLSKTYKLVGDFFKLIEYSLKRKAKRKDKSQQEELDDNVEAKFTVKNQVDDAIIFQLTICVGIIIKNLNNEFKSVFDMFADNLFNYLVSELPDNQKIALWIFRDLIEYLPEILFPLLQNVLPLFLTCAKSDDFEVVEIAFYNIGVFASSFGDLQNKNKSHLVQNIIQYFQPSVDICLETFQRFSIFKNKLLHSDFSLKTKDSELIIPILDNATSALGKLLRYCFDYISSDVKKIFDFWLKQMMPVINDTIQAHCSNEQLCLILESNQQNSPYISKNSKSSNINEQSFLNAKPDVEQICRIIHILVHECEKDLHTTEHIKTLFTQFLKKMNSNLNELFFEIISKFPDEEKLKISNIMNM